jgi:uncharacterized phage protein gp47/JayE
MAPGAKARSILEVNAKEIENIALLSDENVKKALLPTSTGQYLDHFGATVGVARYPQKNAEVLAEDRAIRFYVSGGGTFGSINDSEGFVIPSGITLTVPVGLAYDADDIYADIDTPDSVYDRAAHFSISEDVSCLAEATEVWVSATALSPGAAGNISAPKMLKQHDFTGYADYIGGALAVENTKAILNGAEEESTASYRYRISKELTAAEKANYSAIVDAAMSVAGVADVVIIPWEDGAGRFNVYIKSISSFVSDRTISGVQTAMDEVQAVGTLGYARKPYEVGIEIDSTVTFKQSYETSVKAEIRDALFVSAMRYLNSLDLGQPLILDELVESLKQVDHRISTLGFNRTTFFDAVFAWYPSRLNEGGKRREKLISSALEVPLHARIIAENTIADPIRFT